MQSKCCGHKSCWKKGTLVIMGASFFAVLLLLATEGQLMAAPVKIEKVSYGGWNECYRMTNGEVELIAVAEVGPRIIHFSLVGQENVFHVAKETLGQKSGDQWVSYGGHRLWQAPEDVVVTYYPDNIPVKAIVEGNKLTLIAAPEVLDPDLRKAFKTSEQIEAKMSDPSFRASLGIRKRMDITMNEDGQVTVQHSIFNEGVKPIELASWALTVLTKEGFAIIPNPLYAAHGPGHFLPVRSLMTWSYTDLSDPRIIFLKKYMILKQNPSMTAPIKIGFNYTQNWVAYAVKNSLFVKTLAYRPSATYPDMGCSVEFYTNEDMLEMESLGPTETLKPSVGVGHTEKWRLYKIEPLTPSEQILDQIIPPLQLGS